MCVDVQKSCDAQQILGSSSKNLEEAEGRGTRINNLRKPEEGRRRYEEEVRRKVSIVTIVLVCSVEEKVVYADSSDEAREKPKKEGRKEGRKRTKERSARRNQS